MWETEPITVFFLHVLRSSVRSLVFFDFLVTNASLLDLVLDIWGHDTDFLRALRVARVLRLLRLNANMARFEHTFVMVAEASTLTDPLEKV